MKLHEKWKTDGEIIKNLSEEQHAKEMGMSVEEYRLFEETIGGLKGIEYAKIMQNEKNLDYLPTGKELWEMYKTDTENKV